MSPDAVAQYLQHNPAFFEDYADLMAQIFVPHPHGGRAVSLPERQMLTLREKVKALEHTLADLVETGHSNDSLSSKMHRLTMALLRAVPVSPEHVIDTLNYHLREDFAIPHTAFRAWGVRPEFSMMDQGGRLSDALKQLVSAPPADLKLPYCGAIRALTHGGVALGDEVGTWFGDAAPHLKSLALMPIAFGAGAGGLLALASEDEHRFYGGMGTLYLERLTESLSAALTHLYP
jgi:uncharacterized protein YigA (DUF484 family)